MSVDIDNYIKDIRELVVNRTNGKLIRLIKYTENSPDCILHFDIESVPIKVTTDFEKYCLAECVLDNYNLNNFNMGMVFKKKQPKTIVEEISRLSINSGTDESSNVSTSKYYFSDPFHIYQKLDEFSKITLDYSNLEKEFAKFIENNKGTASNTKIPKELLLSPYQISQLLVNEIKKVNRNREFNHYIGTDYVNPYSLFLRIKFEKESEIGKIFSQIEKDFGYDYMELKLTIDPKTHPFIPPKLEYIKPKIKLPLLLSLMNLEILKLENWNPTITLEYFIVNLGKQLSELAKDYIIPDAPTNANPTISYNDLEYELIKLASITKENSLDKVSIQINIPKPIINNSTTNKYWKSGTGYGNDDQQKWDIKSYIKEQEFQKEELTKCLVKIEKMIDDNNIDTIYESVLMKYIISQISGLNVLELEKNSNLYSQIFNILANLIGKQMKQTIINAICSGLRNIYDEINMLFGSSKESLNNEQLLQVYCLADLYLERYQEPAQQLVVSTDIKENYCQIMKKLQFGTADIQSSHRFIKNKGQKPEQKALMRILSEISSFKSGLPLNWESTIWVRVPKDSFNLFTFLISGPKDTPYENGLFEFHASLPADYPNGTPQVLIHTTGNGSVRFNPNLYDSGKVCLSLLGTWQGQEGEKWNPKTSTFLQVMVSIQSLILVEQPYFNEPGWEREMHTPKGKQSSANYNEERQPHTINLAMIDMIKNPPKGYEEVVKNHFRMKKEEIINSTLIWQQNATKHGKSIEAKRNELINLLETL